MFTFLRTTGLKKAGALDLSVSTASKRIVELKLNVADDAFDRHDAEDAIDALDGRKYDGRELSVQYARYWS